MHFFRAFCREHGILYEPEDCFAYLNALPEKYTQMSFLDTQQENGRL